MDEQQLVAWINRRHQTSFRLADKLAGGRQDGAQRLIDAATGSEAVLKRAFAPDAAAAIRHLRDRGYPTPEWLAWGSGPDGECYLVQAFAAGSPPPRLTAALLDQIIALNRLQAGGNPDPSARQGGWSEYAERVVFANESGWADQLRGHSPASAALIRALDSIVAPYRDLELPNGDIVHGDFNLENLLIVDDRISAVIDAAYAGYGTRAIDLASLLHFAYVHAEDAALRQRLHAELLAAGGRAVQCVCLAYRSITMAGWAIEHMPPESVDDFVRAGQQIAADLVQMT